VDSRLLTVRTRLKGKRKEARMLVALRLERSTCYIPHHKYINPPYRKCSASVNTLSNGIRYRRMEGTNLQSRCQSQKTLPFFPNVSSLYICEKRRRPIAMQDTDRERQPPDDRLYQARSRDVKDGMDPSVDGMELLGRVWVVCRGDGRSRSLIVNGGRMRSCKACARGRGARGVDVF
jgi:hypothetical protein